jgi:tRNA pseudouridine55 synthase
LRALDGMLLLDKPGGRTSNHVLQQVRKMFKAKKAGHTGSLDPAATGMLPICFGEATKLCGYLLDAEKTYEVEGLLGSQTDTEDAEGEVIAEAEVPVLTMTEMESVVEGFLGDSMQMPPAYSAIKRDGVRVHKLARKGLEVKLDPRPISVRRIELTSFDGSRFRMQLRVSKGTYIRSIVRDIGLKIGCGAHVTELRRRSVAPFDDHRMVTIEEIESADEPDSLLLGIDAMVADWEQLMLDAESAQRFRHGAKPRLADSVLAQVRGIDKRLRIYDADKQFIGLGQIAEGRLQTVRLIGAQRQ